MPEIVLNDEPINTKDSNTKVLKILKSNLHRRVHIIKASISLKIDEIREKMESCNHMCMNEFVGETNGGYDLHCSICSKNLGKRMMIGDMEVTLIRNIGRNKRLISTLINKYDDVKIIELDGKSYLRIVV